MLNPGMLVELLVTFTMSPQLAAGLFISLRLPCISNGRPHNGANSPLFLHGNKAVQIQVSEETSICALITWDKYQVRQPRGERSVI